jgi:hypothetical protein
MKQPCEAGLLYEIRAVFAEGVKVPEVAYIRRPANY